MPHLFSSSRERFLNGVNPVPLVRSLPLPHPDVYELYRRLTFVSSHPSFLLESGKGDTMVARYSFMGCEPYMMISGKGNTHQIWADGQVVERAGNPFIAVASHLDPSTVMRPVHLPPFIGGAVGLLSYDLVRQFECLPQVAVDDMNLPDVVFLFVDLVVAIDHLTQTLYLLFTPPPDRLHNEYREQLYQEGCERLDELENRLSKPNLQAKHASTHVLKGVFVPQQSRNAYTERVQQCQAYIAAGDIYQANISHRFTMDMPHGITEDEKSIERLLYQQLRRVNPSPFSALLQLQNMTLVSSSPERLVRLRGRLTETRPIAGTRPRGRTVSEDQILINRLRTNPKERAEHLMLVDLARNDLGRVCRYGSIHVDAFMTVEQYSHVAHLVSNVVGELQSYVMPSELIRAVFPGGTITGVPKIRCMEIIEELEPVRRGPYTGSIGYWSWSGDMDFNIVIRTVLLTQGQGYVQVGAGIVADSHPDKEYEETLHKAEAMLQAVG